MAPRRSYGGGFDLHSAGRPDLGDAMGAARDSMGDVREFLGDRHAMQDHPPLRGLRGGAVGLDGDDEAKDQGWRVHRRRMIQGRS